MTPEELKKNREDLGWTRAELARQTGHSVSLPGMWEAGVRRIPEDVADWVKVRAEHARTHKFKRG